MGDGCSTCQNGLPVPDGYRLQICPDCGRSHLVPDVPDVGGMTVPSKAATPTLYGRGHGMAALAGLYQQNDTPVEGGAHATLFEPQADSATLYEEPKTPVHIGRPHHGPRAPELTMVDPLRQKAEGVVSADILRPGLTLGGCRLVTRVGVGGMGTVWLARQLSLDRNVAVKILRTTLANDLGFVIQFTQEALAAAQLVHHNIAQIYDSGSELGLHYFSMEYVEGESLSQLLRRQGKIDPEVAAGYILQAARGLKYAHDRAMLHRDVKPENLLLNRDGIVKVADLGLVKRMDQKDQREHLTPTSQALGDEGVVNKEAVIVGTPAYIAPEQASNGDVDGRADIYSLGCTFYALITGRPPFDGDTPQLIIHKHLTQAPAPLSKIVPRTPPSLVEIISKMMAKKPADRFQNAGELIQEVEEFLGVDGSAVFSPREEHAALLERSVLEFNQAPWARGRRFAAAAFIGLWLALTGAGAWLGFIPFAGGVAAFGTTCLCGWSLVNAIASRSGLLLKLRHLALGVSLIAWGIFMVLVGLGIGALAWYGWLYNVLELLGLALAVMLGFYLVVDRRAARQRKPPVDRVEQMLKAMRLKGLEEMALRQFVCRYAGNDWEPFYEALFGYDAKLQARAKWGRDDRDLPRIKRGAWKDPLLRWVNRRIEARQRAKDEQHLADLTAVPATRSWRARLKGRIRRVEKRAAPAVKS
jgi:hypothetical protein